MKKEFSNNQLITIAVMAIALSLVSMWISVGELDITGAVTGIGTDYKTTPFIAILAIVLTGMIIGGYVYFKKRKKG
ncbi:unnamed protein product [marine sediment metagenome]|uniref:Uncharacterized protein n=1 Tax=marine sediment metagenome TaxID=412755 RepID=X0SQK3_9ZZZZ